MSVKYNPPWHHYTEAEIKEISAGMRALPTYNDEYGGSVSSTEMAAVIALLKKEGNPDQIRCYKGYWDNHYNGRIPVDKYAEMLVDIHIEECLLKFLAKGCDKNNDGFISEDEFVDILEIMRVHDARLRNVETTFENFVKEADTDKDGKVSLDECCAWMSKKLKSAQ